MRYIVHSLLAAALCWTPRVSAEATPVESPRFAWTLQVIYPDDETKTFLVRPSGVSTSIQSKNSWRCRYDPIVSETVRGSYAEHVALVCVKGDAMVVSKAVCVVVEGQTVCREAHLVLSELGRNPQIVRISGAER